MLESLKHEDLQFQELSPEEKEARGILARLTGPIASFTKGTRNGRKYSDKLWEKAFDSPLVKEMFKNGGLPGELQHPENRSETDPTKIAIMMPEPPKKDSNGHLVASVDILDTPCGQIAYQLGKYGFKFGISSRGEGDLIQDFSGEESVDPDTYTLNAFDLVLIPACEDARLQFNESLNTKSNNKLKTILSEALKNASDTDRRIMEEALDELDIDDNWRFVETYHDEDIYYDPDTKKYIVGDLDNQTTLNSLKNAKEYIDRFNPNGQFFKESLLKEGGYEINYYLYKPFEDGWEFSLSSNKSYENFDTIEELQQALKYNGLPASLAEFNRANFDKDNGYIRTNYQNWHAFAYPPSTSDNWSEDGPIVNIIEGKLNEEQVGREETKPTEKPSEILKNKEDIKDEEDIATTETQSNQQDNNTIQSNEEDEETVEEALEDEEPERESWDTDFHRLDVAYNHNFKQFDDREKQSGMIRDFTDDLEAQGKKYDIYDHTSDPGCTIFFQESLNESEDEEDMDFFAPYWEDLNSTEQSAVETALVEIKNGSSIEDAVRGAVNMYNEENANPDYEDEDFYMEEANLQRVMDYVKSHSKDIPWDEPSDEQIDFDNDNYEKKYGEPLTEEKYTRDELFDKFGTDNLDIINAGNEEKVELAGDNDMAMVEQLQNILKLNKTLEEKVKNLQEKLSVSYAKEMELKEDLDTYKQKITKLSKKTKEVKVLTEKLSKAEQLLKDNKAQAEGKISTLNESIQSKSSENKDLHKDISILNESVDRKNSKIRSLNEQISEYKDQLSSKENDIKQLEEKYENGQKDLEQVRENYSKKLEQQNQIIEKYRRVAKNSVKRYVESQAVRLGVKPDEIVNRLPKSYSFNDIDKICEDLQEYKFNMSNLPFSSQVLNENIKINAKNINNGLVGANPEDEITDYDLKVAEAFIR